MPSMEWAAITPSDTVALSPPPRSLFVQVAGNLVMKGRDGVSATFAVVQGTVLPCSPQYVMATSTTATVIGLW